MRYPPTLELLIAHLKKLPGVGKKTAERFAFSFLDWPREELASFSELTRTLKETLPLCPLCGCIQNPPTCHFCNPKERDSSQLCFIASPKDAYALEETHSYKGLYHVVEHLLSPLDGRHADQIDLIRIEKRLEQSPIQELIFAFDSTLEGDATALFLKQHLSTRPHLKLSRLAFGLPVGTPIEHTDGGTLLRALQGRQQF